MLTQHIPVFVSDHLNYPLFLSKLPKRKAYLIARSEKLTENNIKRARLCEDVSSTVEIVCIPMPS
jgi:hypothetical protein